MTEKFKEIGVVEGFYGRVWTRSERETFIESMTRFGLNTYLYAPKHETALGSRLLEPLEDEEKKRLKALTVFCAKRKIACWVGLHMEAPFDPAQPPHLEQAAGKVAQLAQLGVRGFAVLFDDVPSARSVFVKDGKGGGDGKNIDPFGGSLAAAQAHTFNTLREAKRNGRRRLEWMLCPSRYTLDPELERAYGRFEPDYLKRLHAEIPKEVPWLWTGPRVCSPTITPADRYAYLREAGAGDDDRPLVLWDNYPVNDAAMTTWLHLDPLGGRAPNLHGGVRGYLFNPLLQPVLGAVPGATCLMYANDPAGYRPSDGWNRALAALIPEPLRKSFSEFAALTRPPDPTGGLAPTWPRGSFPLAGRLQRAWQAISEEESTRSGRQLASGFQRGGQAMSGGVPVEPYVVIDFQRVVETMEKIMPPKMLEEARPWLGRLRQVLTLFEANQAGAPMETLGPLRAQYVARDAPGPPAEVLGPWFP
ncbi:MAG: beta-N-acetylglucosaminidase domain-containing protein [bacterium]